MPSVSPLATDMLTCCTAFTMPRRVANSTVRSLTWSSGCAVMPLSPHGKSGPSPRSYGERVGERGFYQRVHQTEECAETPPHPDRKSDPTSPHARGEVRESAAKQTSHTHVLRCGSTMSRRPSPS